MTGSGNPGLKVFAISLVKFSGELEIEIVVYGPNPPVGNIHRGIMAGKLKGAMPAQTPRGERKLVRSMFLLTPVRVSPIIRFVLEHRCSTTCS